MTKAKYYVDIRCSAWRGYLISTSKREAFLYVGISIRDAKAYNAMFRSDYSCTFRIRHKGRTIAQWQDGRRVAK